MPELSGKADALRQALLEDARQSLPGDSPLLANLLAQLGLSLIQQENWGEAESLLVDCLAIRQEIQPDQWTTFSSQARLRGAIGPSQICRGRAATACRFSRHEGSPSQSASQRQQATAEVLERLGRLYDAINQPDEAAKCGPKWNELRLPTRSKGRLTPATQAIPQTRVTTGEWAGGGEQQSFQEQSFRLPGTLHATFAGDTFASGLLGQWDFAG